MKRQEKTQIIRAKNVIEKQNLLNEIKSNHMTLQEIRFFTIYLSKINSRDISTRVVKFPLSDFVKILEIGKVNISDIKATTDRLLGKVVNIPNECGGYEGFQLFKECRLLKDKDGDWVMEIDAHDKALPLMFEFKKNYFKYELWNALRLTSANQIRMYEILKQYEGIGKREVSVSDLRAYLGIAPEQYPRFGDFNQRVIKTIQQALAENTDICYEYELVKKGAKVIAINFTIKKNDNYNNQLTLAEFISAQPEPDMILEEQDDIENASFKQNIEFLAGAMNDEFTETEVEQILSVICHRELKDYEHLPTDRARYHYLNEIYAKYKTSCKKKNDRGELVKNRFKYFLKILTNDLKSKADEV